MRALHTEPLSQKFQRSHPNTRRELTEILKQLTGVYVNSANTILTSHEIIGKNQRDHLISQKLQGWHREILESLNSFRKRFGRLINDLKYFVQIEPSDLAELEKLSINLKNSSGLTTSGDALAKEFQELQMIISDNQIISTSRRERRSLTPSIIKNSQDSLRQIQAGSRNGTPTRRIINNIPLVNREGSTKIIRRTSLSPNLVLGPNQLSNRTGDYPINTMSPVNNQIRQVRGSAQISTQKQVIKSPVTRIRRISIDGTAKTWDQYGNGTIQRSGSTHIQRNPSFENHGQISQSGSRKSIKTRVVVEKARESLEPVHNPPNLTNPVLVSREYSRIQTKPLSDIENKPPISPNVKKTPTMKDSYNQNQNLKMVKSNSIKKPNQNYSSKVFYF